ncbi:MAG: glutathione peroxidase [Clostridia bacterium]|nr:glutathione peroxidase [Clostridia bacterium]
MAEIYDLIVKDADGNDVPMSGYRGKVLLIVNTATHCGFTPQYAGLQKLYETYRDQGLEILDFPCNQFMGQAPGDMKEITDFVTGTYGVTFRIFRKIAVRGKDTEPLFKFLRSRKKGSIKWNFTKFLVGRDGEVLARFEPNVTPERLEPDIRRALGLEG